MRKTYIKLSIIALLGCILLPSCNSTKKEQTEDETRAARILGREQALRLSPSESMDSIAMETILIDVRVRESALRAEGEEELADCYIEAFLATLDSVNPALHNQITE